MAYATAAQLKSLGVASAALTSVSAPDQIAALQAASDLADSYLRSRFTLPLATWGDDLRRAVVAIATYDLMSHRGYNPEAAGDTTIRDRYQDAIRWLEKIAANLLTPSVTDSSSPQAANGGVHVRSREPRGW